MKLIAWTAAVWLALFTAFVLYFSPSAITFRARNRGVIIPRERIIR